MVKWTKEKCFDAAKKCSSKSEFNKKYSGAYNYALKNGFLKEIQNYFPFVGSRYKRCIYACEFPNKVVYVGLTYNLEKRKSQHLRNNDSSVFKYIEKTNETPSFKQLTEYIDYEKAALLEGVFLEQYTKNEWIILNKTKTGGLGSVDKVITRKWTFEKCLEVAKKCASYAEFSNKFPGAINALTKDGKLKEIKTLLGGTDYHPKWNKEAAFEECKKYETLKEFREKSSGAYVFMLKNGYTKEIKKILKVLQRDAWSFEEAKIEALKYNSKKEFRENALGCYNVCGKRGWLNEVCKHMKNLTEENKIYNEKNVIETLKNFSYMEELKKSKDKFVRGCYWWLKYKKLLIEYKKFLRKNEYSKKSIPWTEEMIWDEVKKYKTYKDFRINSKAYQIAVKRKMNEKIKNFYE